MNSDTSNTPTIRPLSSKPKFPLLAAATIGIILLGLAIGWLVAGKTITTKKTASTAKVPTVTVTNTEAGLSDVSGYQEGPIGTLKEGGIKGEGKFHIERPGGSTQTVYLTSTTVDLSPFVGKKVQVWGQTLSSKYSPWFMDVVKIKEVN